MNPVCGLKHLARVLRGCKAFGQVSWLREIEMISQYSGATARDSHPLPYSPLSEAPLRLSCQRSVHHRHSDESNIAPDTITGSPTCQLDPCLLTT
jgi:hypothetical protein